MEMQHEKDENIRVILVNVPLKSETVIREISENDLPIWAKEKLKMTSETETPKKIESKISELTKKAAKEKFEQELVLRIELQFDEDGKIIAAKVLDNIIKDM